MQSPNLGERDDLALLRRLHPPRLRGILVQTQMCSAGVVEVQSTIPHNTRCGKFAIRGITSTANRSSSEDDTIVSAARFVSVILRAKGCRIVLKYRHGCWIERIAYDLGGKPNQRWIGKRCLGCSNF